MRRSAALGVAFAAVIVGIPLGNGLPERGSALAATDQMPPMGVEVLNRFDGDADEDGLLDVNATGVRNPGSFPVRVFPAKEACDAAADAAWSVDGRPATIAVKAQTVKGRCEATLAVVGEGPHTAEVMVDDAVLGGSFSQHATFEINDKLVVAMGDSVASGEGNRDGGWLDERCHRSQAAGFEQAARLLGDAEGSSVTFVSLACSGATNDEGLLGEYEGIEPASPPLAPQVTQLSRLVRGLGGGRVDAILVSIGANDVRFSKVAGDCALPLDCQKKFEARVREDLARLPASYDRLGRQLRRAARRTPVLVSEYFDPTRDQEGAFCPTSLGLLTEDEARWAFESLLRPLNAAVAEAASRNRWSLVDGVAADFAEHGVCARGDRWVRRLEESALYQRDHLGTLHPNERGHTAIADRVAPQLAEALGLDPPEAKEEPESEGLSPAQWIARVIGVPLVIAAVAFLFWLWGGLRLRDRLKTIPIWLGLVLAGLVALPLLILWRVGRLARPTNRKPAGEKRADPTLPPPPQSLRPLAILAAAVVAFLIAAIFFAREIGRSILWVRYWAANLPADQAVDAVSESELITTGSQALGIFVVTGLIGLIALWLLDGKGRSSGATRAGLVGLVVVELATVVLALGDFRGRQATELLVGFVAVGLLAYFLVDRALERATREGGEAERKGEQVKQRPKKSLIKSLRDQLSLLFGRHDGADPKFKVRLIPWRALPLALLAIAMVASLLADGTNRILWVLLPYFLAALWFVAPGGVAWRATADTTPGRKTLEALEPPRVALALAGVFCICTLVVRDELWLAAAATVGVLLAFFCLGVATASGERFAPLGLAVLVTVPLFGAAGVMLRSVDSPELQPVAAVLQDGRAICGVYVGESDGRLWVGQVELAELADVRRPTSRRSSIDPYETSEIKTQSLGTLQPVARATSQALVLRDRLQREDRSGGRPAAVGPTCAARRFVEEPQESPQRDLAEKYQPELVVDREDRFWPIPVTTLFAMQDRRAVACRQVRASVDDGCVRLTTQGEFPWIGGEGEAIEYPAANDRIDEQRDLMVDALGSIDPARTAHEYFLAAGDPAKDQPLTLQYWFFYSFNYQPLNGAPDYGGFHEGDFESIAILLSKDTRQPRYIWMARHGDEGRVFPWDDEAVVKSGDHPVVFAARGSHATYESCARQVRFVFDALIDDNPACEGRQLRLPHEVTALTDLSRVSWGCWQGLFGHRANGSLSEQENVVNDGPRSPLWQQRFGEKEWQPCLGVPDPGGREGLGEEVVEESGVPTMIRERAGRLDHLVDECTDWETPAASGTYVVACDEEALRQYAQSGFEDPGTAGVRIDVARPDALQIGELTVPAVRRQATSAYLDDWRINAAEPATVSVYASCRQGRRVIEARFGRVSLVPGEPLRLSDQGEDEWRLLREDGLEVADAEPGVALKIPSLTKEKSRQELACSAG